MLQSTQQRRNWFAHLEVNRLPAIWYEAELHWDGNYVLGATLPGTWVRPAARSAESAGES